MTIWFGINKQILKSTVLMSVFSGWTENTDRESQCLYKIRSYLLDCMRPNVKLFIWLVYFKENIKFWWPTIVLPLSFSFNILIEAWHTVTVHQTGWKYYLQAVWNIPTWNFTANQILHQSQYNCNHWKGITILIWCIVQHLVWFYTLTISIRELAQFVLQSAPRR